MCELRLESWIYHFLGAISNQTVELCLILVILGEGTYHVIYPLGIQRMNLISDMIQVILMLFLPSSIFTQSAIGFTLGLGAKIFSFNQLVHLSGISRVLFSLFFQIVSYWHCLSLLS